MNSSKSNPPRPRPWPPRPRMRPAPPPVVKAEPTGPQNPIDALAPPDAALPALASSDSRVMQALTELFGKGAAAFPAA